LLGFPEVEAEKQGLKTESNTIGPALQKCRNAPKWRQRANWQQGRQIANQTKLAKEIGEPEV